MTYTTQTVKVAKAGIQIGYTDSTGAASTQNLSFENKTFTLDSGLAVASGDLSVAAGANIGGVAHIEGAATLASTLAVTGAVSAASTVDVTGATRLHNTLRVDGTSRLVGAVTADAPVALGSTLNVTGAATAASTLDVNGATRLHNTLTVDGPTHFVAAIIADNAVALGSTLDVTGATTLSSTALVHGAATFDSSVTVAGASTFNNNHTVNGTSAVNGALTVSGGTTIGGALSVTGGSAIASTLDVTGAVTAQNTLHVVGTMTADAPVALGSTLDVVGAAALASTLAVTDATTLSSTLNVAGATALSSTLAVIGAASLASTLDVTGATHLIGAVQADSTLHVTGAVSVDAAVSAGSTLDVTGAAALHSTADITGAVTAYNTLDVIGATHLHSGVLADGDATLGGSLAVTGATALASTLNVGGNANFNSNVVIAGNLSVLGQRTSVSTVTLEVQDNAVLIANNNMTDTVESGIMMQYKPTGSANPKFAGMKRRPQTGEIVFFTDSSSQIADPPVATADPDLSGLTYSAVPGGYVIRANLSAAKNITSYQISGPGEGNASYTSLKIYGALTTNATETILIHEQNTYSGAIVATNGDSTTKFTTLYFVFTSVTPGQQNLYMNITYITLHSRATTVMPASVDLLGGWGAVQLGSGGTTSPMSMFTAKDYYYFGWGNGVYDADGNYIGAYAHGLTAAAHPTPQAPSTSLSGEWITFDLGTPKRIGSYGIAPYSGSITVGEWTLLGSNDYAGWVTINHGTTPNSGVFEYSHYALSAPTAAYRFIRLVFQKYSSGDDYYFRLAVYLKDQNGAFLVSSNGCASPAWYSNQSPIIELSQVDANIGSVGNSIESPWGLSISGLYSGAGGAYVGSVTSAILLAPPPNVDAGPVADVYATVMADGFVSASDARLKTNVVELQGALDKVAQIRGVQYHWIKPEMSQEVQIGVIAQEVQAVYPQLVHAGAEHLSVDYAKLTAVLIQAVKELKAEVEELKRAAAAPAPAPAQ